MSVKAAKEEVTHDRLRCAKKMRIYSFPASKSLPVCAACISWARLRRRLCGVVVLRPGLAAACHFHLV